MVMTKSLFSPVAGLIQDLLLLSSLFLLVLAGGMVIWLKVGDVLTARKRRNALAGRPCLPSIQ